MTAARRKLPWLVEPFDPPLQAFAATEREPASASLHKLPWPNTNRPIAEVSDEEYWDMIRDLATD